MTLPDRPSAHSPIESAWGQEIHDRVLAASGCDLYSATTNPSVGTTAAHLHLDSVHSDPGGYLDAVNDQIVVPTDKAGLYLIVLTVRSTNGSAGAGQGTRGAVYINGSAVADSYADNDGAVVVIITVTTLRHLSAGDILQAWTVRKGGGTSPAVVVERFQLLRLTDDYGA